MLVILMGWFGVNFLLYLGLWYIWKLSSDQIRHSLLYILLVILWVHSVIDQWLKQTLCVIYFKKLIWGKFGIRTSFLVHFVIDQWIKQTLCLAILLGTIWVYLVVDLWLKHTLCVVYFTELIWVTVVNWPVIKVDTLCWIFYWVHLVYIWYWKSILVTISNWPLDKADTLC